MLQTNSTRAAQLLTGARCIEVSRTLGRLWALSKPGVQAMEILRMVARLMRIIIMWRLLCFETSGSQPAIGIGARPRIIEPKRQPITRDLHSWPDAGTSSCPHFARRSLVASMGEGR